MSAKLFSALQELFAPSDEQLMGRVQGQDDAEAFAELVRRWQSPILRLCSRLLGDVHQAEDCSQEVFTRLYLHRKAFQPGHRFSPYLRRIAVNHCYRNLRNTRHQPAILPHTPDIECENIVDRLPAQTPTPDEAAEVSEAGKAVRRALDALPASHRTIVVLRHFENLKFREIAEVLEIPEGTVKTRMTEALNELARILRRRHDLEVEVSPGRRARPGRASDPIPQLGVPSET